MTTSRLSELHRRVLRMAYAPDYLIHERLDSWDTGVSPRTLAALVRRGLLLPEPDGSWDEVQPSAAGLTALGLAAPLPDDLRAALEQAIAELMWRDIEPGAISIGDDVPSVCVEEDWGSGTSLHTDTSGVLAAVCDPRALHDEHDMLGEDGMVGWSAVARRLSEAGWPVRATLYGNVVYLEGDED